MALKGVKRSELRGAPGTPVVELSEETINTGAVIIHTDPRLIILQLSNILKLSVGSAFTLLHKNLKMSTVYAHWIRRFLKLDQKANRVPANTANSAFEKKVKNGERQLLLRISLNILL